jgi:WD40 repeat protein/serine/threonine protein kinase
MSRDEATSQEEEFAALLAAFDEALAAGGALPDDAAPAEMRPRLAEDLKCLHLLNQLRPPASDRGIEIDAGPAASSESRAPGSEDRYSVLRLHAAGGIGQVWIVHDADLGRDVALKELRAERAYNPAIAARFLREARITGQLQHPGIVPVYELAPGTPDADYSPGAEPPFYTMRFVQGRTLTDAARAYHAKRAAGAAGPLDLAGLLNVFVSVCNTVAYAHSRGVIHRDLKGANVVLGDFGEVMVLDWGFAKVLGRPDDFGMEISERGTEDIDSVSAPHSEFPIPSSAGPLHTMAGQVLGTPAYMAPEQAAARQDLVDCRTDVYGLGAILYEILTGRAPFTGNDPSEVLRQVREKDPPAPETVCRGVPPALAAVCRRALARDPGGRYPAAADLGREVQRWLADEPVAAYRESYLARLRRWGRRHKASVTALAVLLVTVLAALTVGAVLLQKEQARTAAVRGQAAADKAEAESRARKALENQLYYHRIALAEREHAANNLNRATELLAACPTSLRGWEWYCLQRLCHADPLTLRGHTAAVSAVAFSPAGGRLASASHDHTVRIWDTHTRQTVRTLVGHSNVVYGLAYSPNGARLATASWDNTVKVWDVADGRELFTCDGHDEVVLRVVFSPDGRLLVSLSSHAVKVWDAATGEALRTLGPVGGLNRYGLAFSPNGRHVAVTTHHPAVTIWDVTTGENVLTFLGHTSVVKNVAFSPDGTLVASGAGDIARNEPGEVKVWRADTGEEVYTLRGHTDPIYGVAFSPDGRRLVSGSQDHTCKVWDVTTGHEALTLRAHTDTVRGVAFSPDGSYLATACVDGTVTLWDANPWADEKPPYLFQSLSGHQATVFIATFFPDGRTLAALSDNGTIRTWDVDAARELEERRISIDPQIYSLALSKDGSQLATASTDGVVWIIDPGTRETIRKIETAPTGPVKSLAFSPDGGRLAVADWDRTVQVWDVSASKRLHTLRGHEDAVIGVAFSPDGKQIASASYDQTVCVWDAETGRLRHTLLGHTSRVLSVAFSPDGRLLASASNDATIKLWDPATGEEVRTLRGHASGVYGVAFNADGSRLASASNDWTVKLWNPATGAETLTLRGHTDRVQSVSFTTDGRRLASASSDQTVKVWELPPEK